LTTWLAIIQQFQKSAIIVPKPDKKRDFGPVALIIAALALVVSHGTPVNIRRAWRFNYLCTRDGSNSD
jgi:hypothetical protein